jgi:hypothetical protein
MRHDRGVRDLGGRPGNEVTLPERARPGARSSGHGAAVAPGRARNGRRRFQTAGQRNRATLRAIEESLRNVLVSSPADGLACVVLRTRQLLGGQLHFLSLLPRALTVVATGDPNVDRRFQVGVTGNSGLPGRVFTADFTAWLRQLPYGKRQGRDVLPAAVGFGVHLYEGCPGHVRRPRRLLRASRQDRAQFEAARNQ